MTMNIEHSVLERYSQGAQAREEALCCPVEYDSSLLALLPQEIIELYRDRCYTIPMQNENIRSLNLAM